MVKKNSQNSQNDDFSETPLDALIPKIPFSFFLIFGPRSPLGPGGLSR